MHKGNTSTIQYFSVIGIESNITEVKHEDDKICIFNCYHRSILKRFRVNSHFRRVCEYNIKKYGY